MDSSYFEARAFTNDQEKNIATVQENPTSPPDMDATPLDDLYPPSAPSVQPPQVSTHAPSAPAVASVAEQHAEATKTCSSSQQLAETLAVPQNNSPSVSMSLPFVCDMSQEQIEAVLVGTVSILAFSQPIQERLMELFPSFYQNGTAGIAAVLLTGLLAAIGFYFGKRVIPRLIAS